MWIRTLRLSSSLNHRLIQAWCLQLLLSVTQRNGSPSPPSLVTVLLDKIHCDEAGRMKVLAWNLDSVQQMQAWCRERLDSVVDGAGSTTLFQVDHVGVK